MRPGRQDLNVIFLYLGPVAQPEGDRGIVLKFFETAIYFWNFIFFKYKNEKKSSVVAVGNSAGPSFNRFHGPSFARLTKLANLDSLGRSSNREAECL